MNRRGAVTDLFIWVIIGIVMLLIFGAIIFGFGLVSDAFLSIDTSGSSVNISQAAQATIVPAIESAGNLRIVSFFILAAMGLSILISNFLVRTHPVFFVVYIMFIIVSIILSAVISNVYEDLLSNPVLGDTYASFTASNAIILNLPMWVTIIGVVGAVLLFINIQRDPDMGGAIS